MRPCRRSQADWLLALRLYLGMSIAAHLVWEILQLPFYTLWTTGTTQQKAFAVLHCAAGDAMIAGLSLLAALALFGRPKWPHANAFRVYWTTLVLGGGYTIFSEWLTTVVRGSWSYSELMPVLPLTGTGLAPLLQWLVVPPLALWFATGRGPLNDRNESETNLHQKP